MLIPENEKKSKQVVNIIFHFSGEGAARFSLSNLKSFC